MKTLVLKVLCLTFVLIITATGLVTKAAFSTPLSHGLLVTAQTPITNPTLERTPSPETTTPHASDSSEAKSKAANSTQKPGDSKSVDSEHAKPTPENKPSSSAGPYDIERIKQFNRALYGS